MKLSFRIKSGKDNITTIYARIRYIRAGSCKITEASAKTPYTLSSPKYWNDKNNSVRDWIEIPQNEKDNVNSHIKYLERAFDTFKKGTSNPTEKEIHDFFAKHNITKEERIKKKEEEEEAKDKQVITLNIFIDNYIKDAQTRDSITTNKPLKKGTIQKFIRLKELLNDYWNHKQERTKISETNKREIDFGDIDMKFYNGFSSYLQHNAQGRSLEDTDIKGKLQHKGYALNTVGKYINSLKAILNEASAQGINNNFKYKSKQFKVQQEEVTNIYLSEEEIKKIEKIELPSELENARVSFLIGCYTGLRYSDFSRLTVDNIRDGRIYITQQKTGKPVVIPLHPYIKNLLPQLSNYKDIPIYELNRGIKKICKIAGINEPIIKERTEGGQKSSKTFEKWELVSCHTARRSFATNAYLNKIPAHTIMKITGHTTEKAFLKYIKISNEQNADILAEYWSKC